MRLVSKEELKPLLSQIVRYLFVGILNNVIYYATFLVLINYFDLHYSISVLIAYLLSIFSGYLMNTKFAFRIPSYEKKSFLKYSLLYGTSFLINLIVLFSLVEFFSLQPEIAQIAGSAVIAVYNFIFLKFYVYRK